MPEAAASMPTLDAVRSWGDWDVDEIGGGRIGRVHGAFVDADGGGPAWLIAKLGRRGPLVAIPLRDCAGGGGRVWVAHEKERIRSAPVVDPTRPLLREHELTICAHFGIGEKVGRAAEVVGRPEGAVTSQPSL
jgi:hypothetical protein